MRIPPTPLTALPLALLLAGAARADQTPDGRQIIDDSYVGPLKPDQCRASQCGKSITPEPGAAPFAAVESALLDVGRRQRADSGVVAGDPDVIAYENRMKADGTLKDLIRRPDGAIYVFPDGKVSWSDYVGQYVTKPYDPAACAGNPGCPAQLKTYLDKQAQAQKEKDYTAAQDKNMFQSNMFSPDADKSKSPPPAQDLSVDPDADGFLLGEALAQDRNLFPVNQNGQDAGSGEVGRIDPNEGNPGKSGSIMDHPAEGDFTYLKVRQASQNADTIVPRPAAASRAFDGGKADERAPLDEKDPARWTAETNR